MSAAPFPHGGGARSAALANPELNKYRSGSALVRRVVDPFVNAVAQSVVALSPASVLDVGCGEGHVTSAIARACPNARVMGVDLDAARIGGIETGRGSILALPLRKASVDVVCATEVLEHLDEPASALAELRRVARHGCIVTVPHEPYWRMANLARLTYVRHLGNTPGHVQHWGARSFRRLLSDHFQDVSVRPVSLWLLGVCRLGP